MSKHYQAAGRAAARAAMWPRYALAQLGVKTVLIEKDKLGDLLNRGCIPTKSLLHSAEVYKTVREAEKFGVTAKDAAFDYAKISARKDSVVGKLRRASSLWRRKPAWT